MDIYITTIFDQLGLKEPETWDEFNTVLETLKKNNVTPLSLWNKGYMGTKR